MDVLVADAVLYQEAMLRLAKRKKLSHARIWYAVFCRDSARANPRSFDSLAISSNTQDLPRPYQRMGKLTTMHVRDIQGRDSTYLDVSIHLHCESRTASHASQLFTARTTVTDSN